MLYNNFEKNLEELVNYNLPKSIAVSVSGGADSISLLLLVSEWNKKHKLPISVFTVNHNLRPESLAECNYVKELSIKLGYDCIVLDWDPEGNFSNLQARARKGRYDIITQRCKEKNIPILLSGHHLDDYLENFLLRQNRKSGEFGLSSSNVHFYNNVKIVRPFHNIKKIILSEYLTSKGIKWVEDISNYSNKYERSKIRNILSKVDTDLKFSIITTQEQINQEVSELRKELIAAVAETCNISEYGFTIINLKLLDKFSQIIKLQLLSYILNITGGKNRGPRGRGVELLLSLIIKTENFTNTLHGCSIKKIADKLIIMREFGLHPPDIVTLKQGAIWDRRFIIKNCLELEGAYISCLNDLDYIKIKDDICLQKLKTLSLKNHKKILFTLPIIKNLEKIIAIPHISFYNDICVVGKVKFLYHPEFISRFIHLV